MSNDQNVRIQELLEYIRNGRIMDAMREFYAEDVVMEEPAYGRTEGLAANLDREQGRIEEAYAGYRRAVELYNELLREFCREVGIRYIPLAEEYVEHSDRFIDICHVDSDGERLKAEIMAEHLVERIRASFEASTYAPAARPEGQ